MQNLANVAANYRQGFEKCYPQHRLELRAVTLHGGFPGFYIYINGDRGDRPLSEAEMASAAVDFLR